MDRSGNMAAAIVPAVERALIAPGEQPGPSPFHPMSLYQG